MLSWRAHGRDLVAVLGVIAIATKATVGIGGAREPRFDDESLYLASGMRLLVPGYPNDAHGLPSASWGPLYSCWYFVLHLFEHDPSRLYFLSWSLLVLLVCLAQYALQRTLGVSAMLAMLTTCGLATCHFFDVWPYPAHFAALCVLVGATFAARARGRRAATLLILWTLLACVFIRPELSLAFSLTALVALAVGARTAWSASRWRPLIVDVASVAIPAALLVAVFGNPNAGTRAFYAWGQHYALQEVTRHGLAQDPWVEWYAIVQRDFGPVGDLTSALRANPAAFFAHLGLNGLAAPHAIYETFEPSRAVPTRVAGLFFGLFVGFGALGLWLRPRRARLSRVLTLWLAIATPTVVGALLVYPRDHYFVVLGALSVALLAAGLSRGAGPTARVCFALAIALFVVTPRRAVEPANPPSEQGRIIGALASLRITQHVVVLEQGYSYALYAGLDFKRIEEWNRRVPFLDFLGQQDASLVVLTDAMSRNPNFSGDLGYQAFQSDPARFGFQAVPVPSTGARIAIRNDVPRAPD